MKLLIACLEHDHIYRRDEPQITPFGNSSPCLFKGSLNLFLLSKKRGKRKDRDCRVKGWGGEGGMGEGGEEGRASSSVPSSVSLPQTEYTLISSLNLPEKFQHPKKRKNELQKALCQQNPCCTNEDTNDERINLAKQFCTLHDRIIAQFCNFVS